MNFEKKFGDETYFVTSQFLKTIKRLRAGKEY
jgi:hypothetical protein